VTGVRPGSDRGQTGGQTGVRPGSDHLRGSHQAVADLLETILAATRRIVEVREADVPLRTLEATITRTPRGDRFAAALGTSPPPRVIAECKRRSPSRGILRSDYDPAAHAVAYARAGAAAISVLTEPTFFDGDLDHLRRVRAAVDLPLLRKDFVISAYQLVEAAACGADAVLLIVAALDDPALRGLIERGRQLGLALLVEVHDTAELDRALRAGASIVGVNSRNLRTLEVVLRVLDAVASVLPDDVIAVAESGLKTRGDLDHLATSGYDAFLVGERLITQPDPGAALKELRGL
jgi:indole-3-glycerol phosphate synthase